MYLEFRKLKYRDWRKARKFIGFGEDFEHVFKKYGFVLWFLRQASWYKAMHKATRLVSAYYRKELVGVVMASVNGEEPKYRSLWVRFWLKVINAIEYMILCYTSGRDKENSISTQVVAEAYKDRYNIDVEIFLLATNPKCKQKIIAKELLNKLGESLQEKEIYAFTEDETDTISYKYSGFTPVGTGEVILGILGEFAQEDVWVYKKKFSAA